jgi:hypothetical protein
VQVNDFNKVWVIPTILILSLNVLVFVEGVEDVRSMGILFAVLAFVAGATWGDAQVFRRIRSKDFYLAVDGNYYLNAKEVTSCTEVRVKKRYFLLSLALLVLSITTRSSDGWLLLFQANMDVFTASLIEACVLTFLRPVVYYVYLESEAQPYAVIPDDAKTAILLKRATSLVTCR